jgi:general secretion pathway protein D
VQNGKAEHLAEVLGELFGGGEKRGRGVGGPQLAPGLAPAAVGSAAPLGTSYRPPLGGSSPTPAATTSPVPAPGTGQFTSTSPTFSTSGMQSTLGGGLGGTLGGGTAGGGGLGAGRGGAQGGTAAGATLNLGGSEAHIIADKDNNALVILATPADYETIEAALRKLDVIPRQVLIEASVVEVELVDTLQYGIEWFFSHNIGSYTGLGDLSLFNPPIAPNGPSSLNINSLPAIGVGSGFSYALADRAGLVHVLLNELASKGLSNVLSSPQLMVLDNQTANIKVGAQVPVPLGSALTTGGTTETSIQYRDTGVLLEVTPRVNAGGLVTLDISQEVTDPGISITVGNNNQAATFNQRSIKTTVAVQSGQTLVLGGLITESKKKNKSGIPILYDMPIIGPLFGTTNNSDDRKELLVIITPRVVRDQNEAREVTEELKERMKGIREPLDALRRGVIAPH